MQIYAFFYKKKSGIIFIAADKFSAPRCRADPGSNNSAIHFSTAHSASHTHRNAKKTNNPHHRKGAMHTSEKPFRIPQKLHLR